MWRSQGHHNQSPRHIQQSNRGAERYPNTPRPYRLLAVDNVHSAHDDLQSRLPLRDGGASEVGTRRQHPPDYPALSTKRLNWLSQSHRTCTSRQFMKAQTCGVAHCEMVNCTHVLPTKGELTIDIRCLPSRKKDNHSQLQSLQVSNTST